MSEPNTVRPGDATGHVETKDIIPPFSEYEHYMGEPYAAKFFGLSGYKIGLASELDKMMDKSIAIEEWARHQIADEQLENTLEAFKFVIGRIKGRLGLPDHTHPHAQLDKIYDYISRSKPDNSRAKIKKIRDSLFLEHEQKISKLKETNKAKLKAQNDELSKAYRVIRKMKEYVVNRNRN